MARANGIDIKLPDLQQQIVFNVSGEDKLKSIGRALNDIASGTKMHQYLSDQETMVRRLIEAYTQYGRIQNRSSAGELIKSFNALQAVSDGIDLSRVIEGFDQVDAAFKRASADFGKDFTGFSVEHFRDVANAMAELGRYGVDVDKVVSRLGQDANVERLNDQIEQLEFSVGRLQSRLRDVTEERDNLLNGSELQRLQEVEEKFSNLTDNMADEFRAFLRANDLESDEDPWSRYYRYFEQIRDGSMTAKEAITRVRSELADMIRTADAGDTIFSYTQMDEFIQKLTTACEQIEQMRGEIAALSGTAALRGVAQEMSESADLTDKQREAMHSLIQESGGLQSVSQILAVMVDNFDMTDDKIAQSVTSFKELLSVLDSIAHVEPANMSGFNDVLKNLRMVSELDVDKKKMTALNEALQQMAAIPQLSNIANLGSVDLRGFNDIKVSKAALSNLATYLPELSQNVNVERLQALSQVSLANFSADNLKVSKASFDHLRELIETIRGTTDTDAFSKYDYSAGTGMADAVEQVTQKVKQEKEAFREGVEAKKEDAAAAEAAAKAEDDKRKISELLAAALKREEEATDSTSRSAERHTDVIQQQEDAMWEAYRTEQGMHDKSASETEAEIDREIAAYNKRLDEQQAAADKAQKVWEQEEASAMAAADKKADAEERAAERKVKAAEKAAAAAAAAEQKAAEAAVKRTAYDDTKRAVNQYYGLLTSKDTNAAKREDVVMTDAGWASQSGRYAELAQQLNDATASFNMLTDAQNKNNLSGQQIAAINELIATRQKDYALAVENTAAKEAEHAQRSAELAQKKQAEAEAANAAKEAKKQEAEATKAQAQAERDATAEGKKANAEESKRASMVRTLNGIIRQCTDAEKKYAAVRNAPNLRQYFDEFKNGAAKAQELKDKLESGEPITRQLTSDFNDLKVSVDNATTSMQTKGSVFQNYITSGMEQLASRMKYSLGLAAVVYKAVGEVKKMVSTAVELDSAINTLQIVTRASGEEMDEYGKRVSSMAKETAQATQDLITATTTYARLGYSMDESGTLAKYTAMLQGVGDIDASTAQNAITAVAKAFDIGVDQIESAMDKMVVVGNNFPISVSQIAEGMNNAGSMLAVANNSFEESIALLTASNATVQNISKASTGLRTIAARIRKTTTEDDDGEVVTEAKYQEMISALTKHKVSLTDLNGEYRSTYAIIKDIAAVWKDMTSMEQAAVVEALAGTRQQNIFASLMTQFGTAEEAIGRMNDSVGELQESYDIYLNSIQAHVNTIKAAFDELSMDFVNSNLAKGALDILTRIIELLDYLITHLGVLGTALTAVGSVGIVKTIASGSLAAGFGGIAKAAVAAANGLKAVALAAPELLLVAAAIAAITLAVKKYKEAHPSTEELKSISASAKSDAEAAENAYKEVAEQIEKNKSKIKELQTLAANGTITREQEDELENLLNLNETYEQQVAILERKAELAAKSAKEAQKEAAYAQFNGIFGDKSTKSVSFLPGGWDRAGGDARVVLGGTVPETHDIKQRVNELIGSYNYSLLEVGAISNTINERLKSDSEEVKESADALIDDLDIAETKLSQTEEAVRQQYLELSTLREQFDGLDDPKSMAMVEQIDELLDIIDKALPKSDKSLQGFKHNFELLDKTIRDKFSKGIHELTDREMRDFDRWMKQCGYTADDLSKNLADWINELNGEPSGFVNTTWQNIDSLTSFRDELSKTKAALEDYNKAMEGGEKGDDIASMQEIYKGALEDMKNGKYDTNRLRAAASLFFTPQQLADMNFDMMEIGRKLQSSMMKGLFDPDEESQLTSGQRFIKYIKDHAEQFADVAQVMDRGDGTVQFWYNSIEDLASAFGMSEAAIIGFLDEWDAYGVEVIRGVKENQELINQYLTMEDKIGDTKETVRQLVEQMHNNGSDQFEISNVLQDMRSDGIIGMGVKELNDLIAETIQKLHETDETKTEPKITVDNSQALSALQTVQNYLSSIQSKNVTVTVTTRYVTGGADSGGSSAQGRSGTNSSGPSQHSTSSRYSSKSSAVGKSPRQSGGRTLVNELGPELISDNGKAFIANGGHPGFVNLSKNAIVFTADETDEILHGKRTVKAKARAEGTGRGGLISRLLNRGTQARGVPIIQNTWTCPGCGTIWNNSVSRCSRCGHTKTGQNWQCPSCTWWNPTNIGTCSKCGGSRYGNTTAKPTQTTTPTTTTTVTTIYDNPVTTGPLYPVNPDPVDGGVGGVGSSSSYTASEPDPQKVDWIAVRINRLQRTIADLEKVASSGFKKLDVRLLAAREQIDETTAEIDMMNKGYERYMKEAASVGLDAGIAEQVQNGTIDITEYDDETRKKIDEYTEW